jgi:hypothetical protein
MPVYGAGVRKNPGGLTLVSTRHSPRQFPLHPYTHPIIWFEIRLLRSTPIPLRVALIRPD